MDEIGLIDNNFALYTDLLLGMNRRLSIYR